MAEENKIQDAEIETAESATEDRQEKNSKRDFYVELALFLILGILVGIAAKTEASKRVTMGFDDYKINAATQTYNINNLQADLVKKKTAEVSDGQNENAVSPEQEGGTCEQQ